MKPVKFIANTDFRLAEKFSKRSRICQRDAEYLQHFVNTSFYAKFLCAMATRLR